MATKSNRGGGEGTNDRGGVRSTFTPPFNKGSGKGAQDTMNAPFNAPRAGGGGELPTKLYDDGLKRSTAGRSTRDDPGEQILTDPHDRNQRERS